MQGDSSRATGGAIGTRLAAGLAVLIALLAWLWPIGIGGKMPVGGDVTQFFLGLMGFLSEALHEGELPVWNDLWGYGFPGLAESQMGVFYPPHVILYGGMFTDLLPTDHRGGVRRQPGPAHALGRAGGVLGGAADGRLGRRLGAGGVRLVGVRVLPDPPGAPLGLHHRVLDALGMGAGLVDPRAGRADSRGGAVPAQPGAGPPGLARPLPARVPDAGHARPDGPLGDARALDRRPAAAATRIADRRHRGARSCAAAGRCGVPGRGRGLPLAAIQLRPTARLAAMAGGQRDFEYLSGFAETPLHLVNFVAPGLFHRSPAWRPIVWDPFHTSPEECLAYIGLVPLFLAVMVVMREFRRDAAVRLLTVLALATLFLSLGPYVPGFRVLDRRARLLVLPGAGAVGPGDVPGAGDPGGQGIRPMAGVAAAGAVAPPACHRRRRLDPRRARPARAGGAEHGGARLAAGRRVVRSGVQGHALDRRPELRQAGPQLPEVMARAQARGRPPPARRAARVGRAPEVGGHPEPRGAAGDDLPPRVVGDGPLAGLDLGRRRSRSGGRSAHPGGAGACCCS